MQMKTIALFALLSAAVPLSAASAMTIANPDASASAATSTVLHKADYRSNHKKMRRYHRRNRYTPGGHYNKAPSNWHRHHTRPGNWRTRGCIMVGPIWWCP